MPRIRTIKPEFFVSEELFEAERESCLPIRVAYAGLWTQADREGRFEWRPRRLKTAILPYDDVAFGAVMETLRKWGFIERYEVDGKVYGVVPTFTKHQFINNREAASDIPPPPESTRGARVNDASSTGDSRVGHAGQGERKGKEGKGREHASRTRDTSTDPIEGEFKTNVRPLYPKRDGDHRWREALGHYRAARRSGEPLEAIRAAVTAYGAWCAHKGFVGTDKVKQAATFFGDEECRRASTWEIRPNANGSGSRGMTFEQVEAAFGQR